MKKIFGLLIAAFVVFAVYGFSFYQMPDEAAGKNVFVEKKCGTCHSVESEGLTSKSKKSKDLSGIGSQAKSTDLAKFLTRKGELEGKKHAAAFKGTDEELSQLTTWLESLKKK